jgi:hypothetical protein
MIIPPTNTLSEEALDFTFVAAADRMHILLNGVPQLRCTLRHCAAYSVDVPLCHVTQ